MVNLVPPPETVMDILAKTGAYRQGHFIYPNGKHASHYFQMPLAFRYYDNARDFIRRVEPDVSDGEIDRETTSKCFDRQPESGRYHGRIRRP